jgi:hypothetical protein
MIIYKTTCLLNGKVYVGQDSNNNLEYLGSGIYLNRSIQIHGKENFQKETICECFTKEELNEKEKYWIKELNSKYPNGYNLTNGGDGGNTYSNNPNIKQILKNLKLAHNRPEVLEKNRKPRSEEGKKNIKMALNRSEVKEKIRLSNNRPEVLKKHKERQLGKPKSEETKIKMRKPKSEEHKMHMKLAQNRPEVLEKQRKPRGPFSEEHKRNIKLSHQKRKEKRDDRREES